MGLFSDLGDIVSGLASPVTEPLKMVSSELKDNMQWACGTKEKRNKETGLTDEEAQELAKHLLEELQRRR